MNLLPLAGQPDPSPQKRDGKRWSAAIGVAALCGAAASVGLLGSTAPDAVAVPYPIPASIEPIPPTGPSDTLLLPYFETNLDEPPAAPAPAPEPSPNAIPFLPPLPTFPTIPNFFPFQPG
jgi:hypothetical protein